MDEKVLFILGTVYKPTGSADVMLGKARNLWKSARFYFLYFLFKVFFTDQLFLLL